MCGTALAEARESQGIALNSTKHSPAQRIVLINKRQLYPRKRSRMRRTVVAMKPLAR